MKTKKRKSVPVFKGQLSIGRPEADRTTSLCIPISILGKVMEEKPPSAKKLSLKVDIAERNRNVLLERKYILKPSKKITMKPRMRTKFKTNRRMTIGKISM